MAEEKIIRVKDLEVHVYKKKIKNYHINVLPPDGKVRVSVPMDTPDEAIRLIVIKRYDWIKKHVKRMREQERQTEREYVSGESHYFKGKRYLMRVEESKRPRIEIKNKKYIYFYVPPHYSKEQRRAYYERWLRVELKKELEVLVPKWEKIIGVKAKEVRIKKMKTKWGSCNPNARRIWINLELIKKPPEYLEYVIVHELVHLIEKKHNKTFYELMNKFLTSWKIYKKNLNDFIL